ncbi:hypothetical protein BJY04DRAFT_196078 [Aspergillus karnatakaensis]|uniref:lipid droplet assembly factor 1 n=1 Tax=Aspergillus karnatakaensis TaxID=1810916 RepID=UPI003CCD62CE
MSLNTVTSGLGAPLSETTNTVSNTATSATKPVTNTVKDTTSNLPGTFPKDEPPTNQKNNVTMPSWSSMWSNFTTWLKSLIPRGVDIFETAVRRFINWLIPPQRQAEMYKTAMDHPIAATFLACQLLCVGIPLVLFVAGTLIFAAVAMIVWVVLSLLILGPIFLVASLLGVGLWGWGWFFFGLVWWLDRLVLGGMMNRFWVQQMQARKAEEEAEEKAKQGETEEKETNEEKRDG